MRYATCARVRAARALARRTPLLANGLWRDAQRRRAPRRARIPSPRAPMDAGGRAPAPRALCSHASERANAAYRLGDRGAPRAPGARASGAGAAARPTRDRSSVDVAERPCRRPLCPSSGALRTHAHHRTHAAALLTPYFRPSAASVRCAALFAQHASSPIDPHRQLRQPRRSITALAPADDPPRVRSVDEGCGIVGSDLGWLTITQQQGDPRRCCARRDGERGSDRRLAAFRPGFARERAAPQGRACARATRGDGGVGGAPTHDAQRAANTWRTQ